MWPISQCTCLASCVWLNAHSMWAFFFLRKYLCSMKFFPSVHGDPIAQCTLKQILTWEPLLFAHLQSKVSSCKPLRILIILHWNWSWLHLLSHAILCIFTWKCTGNISQSLSSWTAVYFTQKQLSLETCPHTCYSQTGYRTRLFGM